MFSSCFFSCISIVVFIAITLNYQPVTTSYYIHPELETITHIQTPTLSPYIGIQTFNITALTTARVFDNLCSVASKFEVSGRIVLYDGDLNGCSQEDMVRNVQKAGGVSLFYISQHTAMWGKLGEAIEEVSASTYCLDGSDTNDIKISYLSVVPKDIRPVVSAVEDGKKGITFQAIPDPNPYLEPFNWYLFYRILSWVILTPWACINILLAGDTIYRVYIESGKFCNLFLPHIACSIEFISNLIRLIYVSLGPFMTWHIWTYPVFNILLTLTMPFNFFTSLLIALYWKIVCDKIKSLTTAGLDIQKYRYLILLVFIGEMIASFGSSIMRAMYMPAGFWIPLNAFFEFIASGSIAAYFIFQGRRLVRVLEGHEKTMLHSSRGEIRSVNTPASRGQGLKDTIAKMSKWVMASAFFTLLFLLACTGVASPFMYTRWGLSGFMFLTHIAIFGISSTQIIAFRTHVTKKMKQKATTSIQSNTLPYRKSVIPSHQQFKTREYQSESEEREIDISLHE